MTKAIRTNRGTFRKSGEGEEKRGEKRREERRVT